MRGNFKCQYNSIDDDKFDKYIKTVATIYTFVVLYIHLIIQTIKRKKNSKDKLKLNYSNSLTEIKYMTEVLMISKYLMTFLLKHL